MKYKHFSNDKETIDLLEQERLDEINWASLADKAKSLVKNKQVAGDAKTREGGRKAAKFFMKHWKNAGVEATVENLLKWIRGFEKAPDDDVIKYSAQYHKYEAGEDEKETIGSFKHVAAWMKENRLEKETFEKKHIKNFLETLGFEDDEVANIASKQGFDLTSEEEVEMDEYKKLEIIATKKKGKIDDKLTFKPLIPSEQKILTKLEKRKIKKFPSRWRNVKKLEKELSYLSNEEKTVLARQGRIRFKEITNR